MNVQGAFVARPRFTAESGSRKLPMAQVLEELSTRRMTTPNPTAVEASLARTFLVA
jgi:hypothetical protein